MKLSKMIVAAALTAALSTPVLAQPAAPPSPAPAPATPESAAPAPAAPAPATPAPEAPAPGAAAPAESAAPAAGPLNITPSGDIIQTLMAAGQFKTLLQALDATNLTSVLKTPGPLTLFAPTDAAFAAAGIDMSNKTALQQLLVYHIINALVDDSKINGTKGPIPSAAGKPIYIDGSATPKKANAANIIADVMVSNGVIHVVDKVLSPDYTPPPAPAQ